MPEHRKSAVWYVAPFTDDQIARFARNWFTLREAVGSKAEQGAQDLIEAIQRDPSTLRLARIPNLRTMMALIHRVRARLPHGRALLYNEITQAYLQSIDEFRGLREVDYPLAQKKRWLGRVGFEMQRRRSMDAKKDKTGWIMDAMADSGYGRDEKAAEDFVAYREILAEKSEVKSWIMDAIAESGYGRDEKAAEDFVAYIGRRSGLLLPRGPEQFAFMHLSLQEYFAACFLAEQVTSPQWIRHGKAAPGADRESLRIYTRGVIWRETLVFLFELLADQPGWPQTLAEDLFGENFKDLDPEVAEAKNAGVLLARLVVDPHSGFSQDMRDHAIAKCAELEIALQQKIDLNSGFSSLYVPEVARALFNIESEQLTWVWKVLINVAKAADAKNLILKDCPAIEEDVALLANLVNLQRLELDGTWVKDVTPLSALTNLQTLSLNVDRKSDLTPLSALTNLQSLALACMGEIDLTPLSTLTNLQFLTLTCAEESDLTPLSALTNLQFLTLAFMEESDLSPLSTLINLQYLTLFVRDISDLTPLSTLTNLQELRLNVTRESDLAPLSALTNLQDLHLHGTAVSKEQISWLRKRLPQAKITVSPDPAKSNSTQ